MKSWVEVDGGALLGVFHGAMIALRRFSVNLATTVGVRSSALDNLRCRLARAVRMHGP